MKKFNVVAYVLLGVLVISTSLISGCASTRTQENPVQFTESSGLTLEVKTALLADPEVKSLPISVTTFKDRVTLSGVVRSRHQAMRAVKVARHVHGVRSVRDELVVRR